MYILKPVGLVTTFAYSSRHMNVPCYKFETIPNRYSRSYYMHTLRSFRVITCHTLRLDILGK